GTLGRPIIVTDSPVLYTDATRDSYSVLGLTPMAAECVVSESDDLLIERVGGNENITYRYQWEGAWTAKVKGYAYQTTAGTNPTDATLALTSSWSKVVTDDKDTAGVILTHHARGEGLAS
ncbi:MAG: major capsid protein, partial [Planctomycetota bacterium]